MRYKLQTQERGLRNKNELSTNMYLAEIAARRDIYMYNMLSKPMNQSSEHLATFLLACII